MSYPFARFRRPVIFATFYGLLLMAGWLITQSQPFQQQPDLLASAVLVDFVIWPAALFYYLFIKPTERSKALLVGATIVFLRIALVVLPKGVAPFSLSWAALIILLESSMLLLALLRLHTLRQTYQRLRLSYDQERALRGSLESVFGPTLAAILLSEGQVLRFSLLGWWRLGSDLDPNQQAVTTYRESGQMAFTIALLVVCLLESLLVHWLLVSWSPLVAYLITAASGYSMLYLIADLVAAYTRPSFLTKDTLHLRLGLRWRGTILQSNIIRVERLTEKPSKASGLLNGALFTAPNTLLTLRDPIWLQGPYGIRKQVQKIALFVDDRPSFQTWVE